MAVVAQESITPEKDVAPVMPNVTMIRYGFYHIGFRAGESGEVGDCARTHYGQKSRARLDAFTCGRATSGGRHAAQGERAN